MSGTRVTCQDVATGQSDSAVITDDYVLVTDGRAYRSNVTVHRRRDGGWTHVVTVKCDPPDPSGAADQAAPGSES